MAKKVKKNRQVIVDTNIWSFHLVEKDPAAIDTLLKREIGWDNLFMPVIAAMELYEATGKDKARYEKIDSYLRSINKLHLIEGISDLALKNAQRYQLSKPVKVKDNLIASFALYYGLELLTNNISDVQHMEGLKLYPFTYQRPNKW